MNKIIALSCIAVLAGCTAPASITQAPIEYQKTRAFDAKTYKSDTVFVVRTTSKSSGKKTEVTGVPCKFYGKGFSSNFTSPATVKAPNHGNKTPPAVVSCTYNGETVDAKRTPFNLTVAQISARNQNAVAGNGLIGALFADIITGVQKRRRDETKDIYAYRGKDILFGAK